MSEPADSGTEARMHTLTLGFFNPNAPSYRFQDLHHLYQRHEQEKKREYNQRVLEVEDGVFTPLVFSTSGGIERESTMF